MSILTRMRARADDQAGFVLPTAIALVFTVLLIGLVLTQTVDTQTHQTRYETAGEAAFELAESAIYAEAQQMQTTWPGTSTTYGWSTCTQASSPSTGCPGTNLTNTFSSTYTGTSFTNARWTLQVLDDSPASTYANYYAETLVGSAPAYDANGDGRMWIRATATIDGQRRVEVAEMVRYANSLSLPENVVTAGAVNVTNNGYHGGRPIVQAGTGGLGQVDMRCALDSGDTGPSTSDTCANWDPSHGNVQPAGTGSYQTGYTDPFSSYQTLTAAQLAGLKASAIAAGTGHYYPNGTCPTTAVNGIVYIENGASCANFTGSDTWNGPPNPPGIMVVATGSITFGGTETFNGIIYMANQGADHPVSGACTSAMDNVPVITLTGSATINGGLFVDGCGQAVLGANSVNVNFNVNAFQDVVGYATPYLAKETFRLVSG